MRAENDGYCSGDTTRRRRFAKSRYFLDELRISRDFLLIFRNGRVT